MSELTKKDIFMLGMLCLLLITTGVQAIQINEVEEEMTKTPEAPSQGTTTSPTGGNQAPAMIGSC